MVSSLVYYKIKNSHEGVERRAREMRPKKYPYSRKKESIAVTIDSNKLSFTSSEVVQNSEGININHK